MPGNDDGVEQPTNASTREALHAIERAQASGVPVEALGFYSRWWQLETWLRTFAYIELRTMYGRGWVQHLAESAPTRAARDQVNAYMASPDAENPLAYLDVFDLFALIDDDEHWWLFEPCLPPRLRWRGSVDELRALRHRNAHCRRPHRDDLGRLEQFLRDLEPGARRALSSYWTTHAIDSSVRDAVVRAWFKKRHPDAARLVDHARRQYEASLHISVSSRPWAEYVGGNNVTGRRGLIWHVRFQFFGGRLITPKAFWKSQHLSRADTRHLILHAMHSDPTGVTVTFAAVDDGASVADAIGACFDAVLAESDPWGSHDVWENWTDGSDGLDARVQVETALALADRELPFTIFGAERVR